MKIRRSLWLALAVAAALNMFGETVSQPPDIVPAANATSPASPAPRLRQLNSAEPTVRTETAQLIDRHELYPARSGNSRDLLAAGTPASRPPPADLRAGMEPSAPNPIPSARYVFAGRRLEGSSVQAFLTRDESSIVVTVGDAIDGDFQVDAIDADQVTLRHLSSGISQVVRAGEIK